MAFLRRVFGLDQQPNPAAAATAVGDAARDAQDWSAAAAAYREVLNHDASLTAIRVQLAHVLKESGKVDAAIDAYRQAANEAAKDADVRIHLGHALKRLGRAEEAIDVFREVMALNPADRETADEIFRLSATMDVGQEQSAIGGSADRITMLENLASVIRPGVSVVTCSRNRTENLMRALPSWLIYPEIDEVIIVDWTSDEPVHDALAAAGLLDPRIKVIRIEDEPRWILSVAFNAGFRAASCDKILKVDADIVLKDGFFDENKLENGVFIAGNWRDAEQKSVNGFFLIHRENLMEVNGFNEMVVTYGWDDDDLYERLEASGVRRVGVSPEAISHLPHDDASRVEPKTNASANARTELLNLPSIQIDTNRIMCLLTPYWDKGSDLQPFAVEVKDDSLVIGRRGAAPPHEFLATVRRDAEHYAAIKYLSTKVGSSAYQITQNALDMLMNVSSLDAVTPLSITLATTDPDRLSAHGNYLIVRIENDIRRDDHAVIAALDALEKKARISRLGLVVVDDNAAELKASIGGQTLVPFLRYASGAATVTVAELKEGFTLTLALGECREFRLNALAAEMLAPGVAAPSSLIRRDTLYIDAQHGLGNRLRAIASAAAIADKTDRELVVIWEPDHHCECDFTDLFDYQSQVMTTSFTSVASDGGYTTFNYMEIEDGSDRGAPVVLKPGMPAYIRSAYVLNHSASDWAAENAFLRELTPTRHVIDLVESVRTPNDVSVHVRMEAAPGTQIHSYDSPDNWPEEDHVTLQKWRARSHFSNFMARLDQMIEMGEVETIFLAADMPEIYAIFEETYGDRVANLSRTLYDRSREQMHYALADAILLGRSRAMLGSNWSSFSEIALRLSTSFESIQLSGKDF